MEIHSDNEDGVGLIETPVKLLDSAAAASHFSYRYRHRKCKDDTAIAKLLLEDETSYDGTSCFESDEKCQINFCTQPLVPANAALSLPSCWMSTKKRSRSVRKTNEKLKSTSRIWYSVPIVYSDVNPWEVLAPPTPDIVATKRKKREIHQKKTNPFLEIHQQFTSKGHEHMHDDEEIIVYHRRKNDKYHVRKKIIWPSLLRQGAKRRATKKKGNLVLAKTEHTKEGMMVVPCKDKIVNVKTQEIAKVELDERTLKEWTILMEKRDSENIEDQDVDEEEREWWDKERELMNERVKSFISSMHLIQGERKFSQWKGSVIDSIGGAYLTQNVSDTLSSSAFISLAAKYPHGVNSGVENCIGSLNDKTVLGPNSKFKMGTENKCFRRKRIKKEEEAIDWDNLRKYYSKDDITAHDTSSNALDWDAVRIAEPDEIAKAIKNRGMSNHLAERIKNCLNILSEDLGSVNLEWIRDVPPDKAKEYLLSIPGLGLKSVECIRLLTLLHKAFPIDRNAGRVAVRLGWVPLQPLPEGLEFHLLKEYPKVDSIQIYLWPRLCKHDPSTLYELHCHMITLGKVFCTKRNPNCNACPLRADCKYFASALASSQLALPGVQEENDVHSDHPMESLNIPLLEGSCTTSKCVVETEPSRCLQMVECDIEDFGLINHAIPEIRIDEEKLRENVHKFINERNIPLEEEHGQMSKALMLRTLETSSIPMPKFKNRTHLRTEHQVFVLPDLHHVLAGLDKRESNDSCPYLLAVWTRENVDTDECNSEEDTVNGTLLIPVRTGVRGIFPLNGTYFQANEVFADDESSQVPIKVPTESLRHLPRRTLYCGNNISAVCRGMKTHEVQKCFWKGYVCFRGFNRKTREAKPLSARFHLPPRNAERYSRGIKKKLEENYE
ncbi:hypothetical protein ABFX02_12G060900 [Erythranthe guttata]